MVKVPASQSNGGKIILVRWQQLDTYDEPFKQLHLVIYASLIVIEKARDTIAGEKSVLLPKFLLENKFQPCILLQRKNRKMLQGKEEARDATCSQW